MAVLTARLVVAVAVVPALQRIPTDKQVGVNSRNCHLEEDGGLSYISTKLIFPIIPEDSTKLTKADDLNAF